ncbi:hypothetical protein [Anaeromyxobacter paludicola]|uniref:Uncharacterized protein n=1 Tax=Anaeromyxobacter paludicola TaxID=2918171 RepID=A0ABN6N9T5_9BACT|nr:hypothetical protein [Anaeromyxobacter paludicola]BDG09992.1 hypothetical protein AMPC_31050 [Anaeromyxobacter paludicola]
MNKLLWILTALLAVLALPTAAAEPGASLVGTGEAGPLALLGVGAAAACQLYSGRRAIAERLRRLAEHLHGLHLGERLAFGHHGRPSRRH